MPDLDKSLREAPSSAPQWRSYRSQFEVRALAGTKVELRGYASMTESPYEMNDFFGSYSEVVSRGAFAKTIAEGADVAYLANHTGLTLARTKSGTLRLAEDDTGLETVATLNTTRSDARDLLAAVEDGDVDQMSFAFRVVRQEWSPDYEERRLVELNLDRGDVSAVNFGANPATSVDLARSFTSSSEAQLHRLAVELRTGAALAPASLDLVSRVLEAAAVAGDTGRRGATTSDPDAQRRALEQLDLLRRRHLLDAEISA